MSDQSRRGIYPHSFREHKSTKIIEFCIFISLRAEQGHIFDFAPVFDF